MSCSDKIRPVCSIFPLSGTTREVCIWLSILFVLGLAGCDYMGASRGARLVQDADTKSAQGDFARAINLYEAALDDSPRCAEVHYKLALLYDDKLNDPVSALHHFRRYLALSPAGAHAADVKNSIKHDEIAALTVLSGDSVITRSEAARLRNENLNLHKELEARAAAVAKCDGQIAGRRHQFRKNCLQERRPKLRRAIRRYALLHFAKVL